MSRRAAVGVRSSARLRRRRPRRPDHAPGRATTSSPGRVVAVGARRVVPAIRVASARRSSTPSDACPPVVGRRRREKPKAGRSRSSSSSVGSAASGCGRLGHRGQHVLAITLHRLVARALVPGPPRHTQRVVTGVERDVEADDVGAAAAAAGARFEQILDQDRRAGLVHVEQSIQRQVGSPADLTTRHANRLEEPAEGTTLPEHQAPATSPRTRGRASRHTLMACPFASESRCTHKRPAGERTRPEDIHHAGAAARASSTPPLPEKPVHHHLQKSHQSVHRFVSPVPAARSSSSLSLERGAARRGLLESHQVPVSITRSNTCRNSAGFICRTCARVRPRERTEPQAVASVLVPS